MLLERARATADAAEQKASPCDAPPWSRTERGVCALLAAGLLASLPALVHPWYVPSGDASLYLATAQSLLAGEGYSYLGEPFVVRPPGFSLLLAPAIAARGLDFAALNLLVALCGVAAVLLLFAHARPRIGPALAALVSAGVWLNPGFRRLSNEILSDVPGLAALLACLLLERWASRRRSATAEIVLGVAIGLAAYLRAALLLLLPAIAISRLLRRAAAREALMRWRRVLALSCAVPAAAAAAILLPWALRDAAVAPDRTVDQTRLHSYATAMWREDPSDPGSRVIAPGELLRRTPLRALQVADALGSRLQSAAKGRRLPELESLLRHGLVAAILVASVIRILVRRRDPAEIYVACTLLVVLVYFGFGDRLLLPVYALSLAAAAETLRDLLSRGIGRRAATLAASAALVGLAAIDFHPRRDWDEIARTHRDFKALAAAIAARVPEEARLGSALGFNYGIYLGRPVYSLHPAIARAADPRAAAEAVLDRYAVDAVVLWPAVPRERELVPFFEERYGPGKPLGPALLWWVRAGAGDAPAGAEPGR